MSNQRGFNLIELLIVVAIISILAALSAPSFSQIIKSNRVSNGVATFMADLQFTRSEAIRRGGAVIMCSSNAPEAASPICSQPSSASGWASGWIIFQDLDPLVGGLRNESDPVLRVQPAMPILENIAVPENFSNKLRFTGIGRLLSAEPTGGIYFVFGGANYAADLQRTVCVGAGGRGKLAGRGSLTC